MCSRAPERAASGRPRTAILAALVLLMIFVLEIVLEERFREQELRALSTSHDEEF